jgi:hypothetical protein
MHSAKCRNTNLSAHAPKAISGILEYPAPSLLLWLVVRQMTTALKLRLATTVTVLTLATVEPTPSATSGTTSPSATVLLASLVTLRLAVYQLDAVQTANVKIPKFVQTASAWMLAWQTIHVQATPSATPQTTKPPADAHPA